MKVMKGEDMRIALERVMIAFKIKSMERDSLAFWKSVYSRTCSTRLDRWQWRFFVLVPLIRGFLGL